MKQSKFNNRNAFKAEMTRGPHPEYPYKYGGAYFRTEAGRDAFQRTQLLRKSAKRMGWPCKTEEELTRFETWRDEQKRLLKVRKDREKAEKEERVVLREEFGLNKSSVLFNYAAAMSRTGDVGRANRLVMKTAESRLTPDDKVELIKKMIEDRTPIRDFMIRTSQLVGAKL